MNFGRKDHRITSVCRASSSASCAVVLPSWSSSSKPSAKPSAASRSCTTSPAPPRWWSPRPLTSLLIELQIMLIPDEDISSAIDSENIVWDLPGKFWWLHPHEHQWQMVWAPSWRDSRWSWRWPPTVWQWWGSPASSLPPLLSLCWSFSLEHICSSTSLQHFPLDEDHIEI